MNTNYGKWKTCTQCINCNRIKGYWKQHPKDPCPKCGSKVIQKVGRKNKDTGLYELKGDKT